MNRPSAKAVLFDLDGTLLDTLQDLAASGNEVLAGRGLPPHPLDAYRIFIGNGMVNLARDVFPPEMRPETEEQIAAVLEEYRAAYSRNWKNTTVPFPGIAEVLDRLVAAAIPSGSSRTRPTTSPSNVSRLSSMAGNGTSSSAPARDIPGNPIPPEPSRPPRFSASPRRNVSLLGTPTST